MGRALVLMTSKFMHPSLRIGSLRRRRKFGGCHKKVVFEFVFDFFFRNYNIFKEMLNLFSITLRCLNFVFDRDSRARKKNGAQKPLLPYEPMLGNGGNEI